MNVLLNIILATAGISLLSLVGILSLLFRKNLQKIIYALVSFATGALIGGGMFHLLPEAWEGSESAVYNFVLGIIVFFILEKFLYWRHCHRVECPVHTVAYLNIIGDAFHNFLDGVVIAGSFLTSQHLGVITTIAVALHEIPQELGDFGVLLYAGLTIRKAIFYNFLSALTCILGGVITFFVGESINALKSPLLAFSAGGFAYIALVDLIPELRKQTEWKKSIPQIVLILLGIMLMLLLKHK